MRNSSHAPTPARSAGHTAVAGVASFLAAPCKAANSRRVLRSPRFRPRPPERPVRGLVPSVGTGPPSDLPGGSGAASVRFRLMTRARAAGYAAARRGS